MTPRKSSSGSIAPDRLAVDPQRQGDGPEVVPVRRRHRTGYRRPTTRSSAVVAQKWMGEISGGGSRETLEEIERTDGKARNPSLVGYCWASVAIGQATTALTANAINWRRLITLPAKFRRRSLPCNSYVENRDFGSTLEVSTFSPPVRLPPRELIGQSRDFRKWPITTCCGSVTNGRFRGENNKSNLQAPPNLD